MLQLLTPLRRPDQHWNRRRSSKLLAHLPISYVFASGSVASRLLLYTAGYLLKSSQLSEPVSPLLLLIGCQRLRLQGRRCVYLLCLSCRIGAAALHSKQDLRIQAKALVSSPRVDTCSDHMCTMHIRCIYQKRHSLARRQTAARWTGQATSQVTRVHFTNLISQPVAALLADMQVLVSHAFACHDAQHTLMTS